MGGINCRQSAAFFSHDERSEDRMVIWGEMMMSDSPVREGESDDSRVD